MDFLDPANGQDVAGGLARKFVGAMRCPDGNGKGIYARLPDEIGCLLRIGQQHVMGQNSRGARSVLLSRLTGFQ